MSREGGLVARLAVAPKSMITISVIVGFAIALFGIRTMGFPIWSLVLPVIAAFYALVVISRPIYGLLVVICIYFLPIELGAFSLLQVVGSMTAFLMILWLLVQRRSLRIEPIFIPLLLLGVLILLSLSYARDVERVMVLLRTWAFNMAFMVIMVNLVTRFDLFKKVIWVIIIMASMNAAVGIFQFATTSEQGYRAVGVVGHAGSFGGLAIIAFPLTFYQFLFRDDRLKWIGLALSMLLFGGVIASVGRTPTVGLMLVLLATLFTERRRIVPVLLVIALALCTTPFLPEYYRTRVGNLASDIKNSFLLTNDRQLTGRGMLNKAAIEIWKTSPIVGVGIGNFGHYFVEKEFNPGFKRSNKVPPHNIYTQALVETGIIGFLILIWLLSLAVWHVIKARRICHEDQQLWRYVGGVQMLLLVILLSGLSGGNLLRNEFWLFLCLAALSPRVASAGKEPAGGAEIDPSRAEQPALQRF